MPVFHNGARVARGGLDRFDLIEIYHRTAGTGQYPLLWSDLLSNTYLRQTYQKADGTSARLGTSVVGSPSFRTAGGLRFLPDVLRADLTTGEPGGTRNELTARFAGPRADVVSLRSFREPGVGRTSTGLAVGFVAREDIALDGRHRGGDAFRLLTVSSMFAGGRAFDANVLRFEDAGGAVRVVRIGDATPRGVHLLPPGVELGSWVELVKETGSDWFPESPTIRVEVRDRSGVPGRLGVQGFLAETRDPNDDSLNVWLEWLDAPAVVPSGARLGLAVEVSATPPSPPG